MSKNKVIVFLITKDKVVSSEVRRLVKLNHEDHRIEPVRSHKVSEPHFLATIINQNKNRGFVYLMREEFSDPAIKAATETGIPFYILSKNNGGLTSSCINRQGEEAKPRAMTPQVA